MSLLQSSGRRSLEKNIQQIIDVFLTEEDLARGIFLKPNIVFPVREGSNEITSTALVRAVVAALRRRSPGVDIVIGEGVAAGCDPQRNFCSSGFASLACELKVPLVDLHGAEKRNVTWKFGQLHLPRLAFERTYINLPKLKPSSACIISGALKNQKGLITPGMKRKFHRMGLHEQIAQLNATIRPRLTIMDCSNYFGKNTLLSGDNCGEIDSTACRILGIPEPEYLRLAREAGVFRDGYVVSGDDLHMLRSARRPEVTDYKTLGRLRLWSNPQACTGCRFIFQNAREDVLKHGNAKAALKLLPHVVNGAEVIMGLNAKWIKEYDTVICVGECTRKIAEENGYIFVEGCPPETSDFYDNLP